jgi:hypothetical protein
MSMSLTAWIDRSSGSTFFVPVLSIGTRAVWPLGAGGWAEV